MVKQIDKCVTSVKKSIKKKKISGTYINKEGKRVKSNPYAICYSNLKKKKTKGGKK